MADFLGIPYPVRPNSLGFFHSQGGANQIKSDLLILLLTNPGERCFLPDFGTPLRSLIFEPNDAALEIRAKKMIINAIQQWEPRIVIQQIQVSSKTDNELLNYLDDKSEVSHILWIKIMFVDPQNIKEVQELKLEIPLSGA